MQMFRLMAFIEQKENNDILRKIHVGLYNASALIKGRHGFYVIPSGSCAFIHLVGFCNVPGTAFLLLIKKGTCDLIN